MTFYRVHGGMIFGGDTVLISDRLDVKSGDSVSDVFATPHIDCVAYMVSWNHAKFSRKWGGGRHGAQRILTIDADDFVRPDPSDVDDDHVSDTDRDQVIISNGTIRSVDTPSDFLSNLNPDDYHPAWGSRW